MRRLALLALVTAACAAADPVAEARAALATEDFAAKKAAIGALASAKAGDDAQAIPLLIGALSDRQGGELALKALRSRSGLSPSSSAYPRSDDAAGWGGWWAEEQQRRSQAAKLKELEKKAKPEEAGKPADLFGGGKAGSGAKPQRDAVEPPPLPDDLGRLDRLRLKAGGSVVAYIRSKRLDENGVLVSVRIVHETGGEETLAASLIESIDEDIR
ncbi:MAG: hypothetical protein RLZZ127_1180 [Planctomycetota bacterium]|jgi:hypothetical protein